MNKYAIIGIVLVVLLGGGVAYQQFLGSNICEGVELPQREVTVISKKLEWTFAPEEFTVGQCEPIKLVVINEDNFDHGIAIDALGISQRLPANETVEIEFVSPKAGTFPFYCSVSCSDSNAATFSDELPDGTVLTGPYAGEVRGHFDHLGTMIVAALENLAETLGFKQPETPHLHEHIHEDGVAHYHS